MNEYHREQSDAIIVVRDHLKTLSPSAMASLRTRIGKYLGFRKDVDSFLRRHFSELCTETCFQNRYSACCSREGITTFFADVMINVLVSPEQEIDGLLQVLSVPNVSSKCVYLGKKGCLWRVKPIVCEMFLCEHARNTVFNKEPRALREWERLKRREKTYTWPSRPVLFDDLETYFIEKGYPSSLMYLHNSPGLLRVKAQARGAKRAKTIRCA
jgi:hypothetical protein